MIKSIVNICAILLLSISAMGANRYWIATTAATFSVAANWSATSGGAGGASVPGSSDIANFDGASGAVGDCNITNNRSVAGIIITSGYSGIITQQAGFTVTIGTSNYSQAGGTFTGGNSGITFSGGTFTLSGGTFTSTSGTLTLGGSMSGNKTLFTHSAGTFNHNNGTTSLTVSNGSCSGMILTMDVIAATRFYNFTINTSDGCGYYPSIATASGDTLEVVNDFTTGGSATLSGMFQVKNNLIVNSGDSDKSIGKIILDGTGAQTYTVHASAPRICQLIVNKTAGAVTPVSGSTNISLYGFQLLQGSFTAPTGNMKVGGDWDNSDGDQTLFIHSGGTFTHNNGTFVFDPNQDCAGPDNYTIDIIPSTQFYNVSIEGGDTRCGEYPNIATASNDTVEATNHLTHNGGYIAGLFEVRKNLNIGPDSDGGTGKIIMDGSTAQTYSVNASVARSCELVINNTSGGVTPNSTTNLMLSGFELIQGSFTAPTGNMNVGGQWTSDHTIFSHSAGTFTNNNGTVIIDVRADCPEYTFTIDIIPSTSFYNLSISGEENCGSTMLLTIPSTDTLTCSNNLTLADGTVNTGYLEAQGNVTVSSGFDGGTAALIFSGGNAQNFDLTGATAKFDGDIKINKSANNITLLSACQLDGTNQDLVFVTGNIISTSTNVLIIGSGRTATGASNSSFVSGPVAKIGTSVFTFPIGKDAKYRPISTYTLTGSGTPTFTATYFHSDPNASNVDDPGAPYDVTSKDVALDHISRCEYWTLNRTGTRNAGVTLSWDSYSCGVDNLTDLVVARWDAGTTTWKNQGNGGTTGAIDPGTGTVKTNSVVATFSPFTLASLTTTNPVPVELLYFTATAENNSKVRCEWSTATEINNDYFAVERSQDGITFSQITTVHGAPGGNSNMPLYYNYDDLSPYTGVSYYRLKQVDFNGQSTYSSIQSVYIGVIDMISIYPNPSSDGHIQYVLGSESGGEITVQVMDVLAREVMSQKEIIEEGITTKQLSTAGLSNGLYLLKVTNSNMEKVQRQFLINRK